MNAKVIYRGMWQVPVKVVDCLCPDGKRRVATLSAAPDTFFSIPARVKAYGKTVAGYVTGCETDGKKDLEFRPYLYRKNHGVFSNETVARM